MKKLIIFIMAIQLLCSFAKEVDFFTTEEIKKGIEKNGIKIYLEKKNDRVDLLVYKEIVDINNRADLESNKVLKIESILVYISSNDAFEVNLRKSTRTSMLFFRTNIEEVITKFPIRVDYINKGSRKSVFICSLKEQIKLIGVTY